MSTKPTPSDSLRRAVGLALLVASLTGCTTLSAATGPAAIELHVATDGSDSGNGTAAAPLASVQRAIDVAGERLRRDRDQDVVVVLHDGVHRVDAPIRVGPSRLPRRGHRLTITGRAGARPVISGGRVIDGWSSDPDGTLRCTLPEVAAGRWRFRQLYVNGERRPRARHPNEGFLRVDEPLEDGRSGFTFEADDIPLGVDGGGELVFLHDWSLSRIRVDSVDHRRRRLTTLSPVGARLDHYRIGHFEPHPRYRLENHPALLDAPGEWHLDESSGVLRYRPLPGETASAIEAIAPVAAGLLSVRGTDEQPARQLHVRGVDFEHVAWSLPAGGYAGGQATVHDDRRREAGPRDRRLLKAGITFENAEDCSLTDCRIAHIGPSAVWFGSRTTSCSIRGCVVDDVGGNGINLGEDTSRRIDGAPWWRVAPEQATAHHLVADSLIQRCGQELYGAVGVWVGLAHDIRIEHNEIRELPYTGVSVGWMWNPTPTPARGNVVEYNHIYDVMRILSDGGGIYTLGRQPGTSLSFNHIHRVPVNAGRAESNGMFLDQGSDGLTIADNVIHGVDRSPLRFHQALSNVVRDNVLEVPDRGTPPIRYNNTDPATIIQLDNTVVDRATFDRSTARSSMRAAGPRPPWAERLSERR